MTDDLDDILTDAHDAEVERRFRDHEHEAEIERMRREKGGATPARGKAQGGDDDDLAGMKAALDREGSAADDKPPPADDKPPAADDNPPPEGAQRRFVLALCRACEAKNRIDLSKLRHGDPRCGRCKKPLAYLDA